MMKQSHRLYARRKALQVLDEWVDVTGVVDRFSGYYDELCSIIETAVDIGQMVALDVPFHINDDGEAVEEHPFESGTYDGIKPETYSASVTLNPKQDPAGPFVCTAKIVAGGAPDRDGNVFPEDIEVMFQLTKEEVEQLMNQQVYSFGFANRTEDDNEKTDQA